MLDLVGSLLTPSAPSRPAARRSAARGKQQRSDRTSDTGNAIFFSPARRSRGRFNGRLALRHGRRSLRFDRIGAAPREMTQSAQRRGNRIVKATPIRSRFRLSSGSLPARRAARGAPRIRCSTENFPSSARNLRVYRYARRRYR